MKEVSFYLKIVIVKVVNLVKYVRKFIKVSEILEEEKRL